MNYKLEELVKIGFQIPTKEDFLFPGTLCINIGTGVVYSMDKNFKVFQINYSEEDIKSTVENQTLWSLISHNHDDRYYTPTQTVVNSSLLNGKPASDFSFKNGQDNVFTVKPPVVDTHAVTLLYAYEYIDAQIAQI